METNARRALSELIDQLLVPGASEPVAAVVPAEAPPASPFVEVVPAQPVVAQPVTAPPAPPQPVAAAPVAPEPAPAEQVVQPAVETVQADVDAVTLAQYGIQVLPDHPVRPVPVQRAPEPPALPSVPQAFTVLPGGAKSAIMWRSRHG
ncbi:MAG: hypothetical protein ACLGIG_04650 [Actinomycetes bacterium]